MDVSKRKGVLAGDWTGRRAPAELCKAAGTTEPLHFGGSAGCMAEKDASAYLSAVQGVRACVTVQPLTAVDVPPHAQILRARSQLPDLLRHPTAHHNSCLPRPP